MQSYADYAAQMRADAAHMSALVTCGCALPRRVPELFLCETCVALSCDQCTAVEIDAYFCANCFATLTAAAAAQDGYRCKHCMECPSCTHVLSLVRDAASVCKFVCESCHWVSDSIGLVDAVPTGLLIKLISREREASGREDVHRLVKHFRARETLSRKARQALQIAANAAAAAAAAAASRSSSSSSASSAGIRVSSASSIGGLGLGLGGMSVSSSMARASVSSLALAAAAISSSGSGSSALAAVTGGAHANAHAKSIAAVDEEVEARAEQLRRRLHAGAASSGLSAPSSASDAENTSSPTDTAATAASVPSSSASQAAPSAAPASVFPSMAPLSEAFLARPNDAAHSTLAQRLAHPESQAPALAALQLRRKQLWSKHAHRCRRCRKYLVKPSPQPRAAAFERRALAMLVLPATTFARPLAAWALDAPQSVTVFFTNRLQARVRLTIAVASAISALPTPSSAASAPLQSDAALPTVASSSSSSVSLQMSSSSVTAASGDATVILSSSSTSTTSTASIATHMDAFDVLHEHDEAALDDGDRSASAFAADDDRAVIAYRRANRVGVRVQVVPRAPSSSSSSSASSSLSPTSVLSHSLSSVNCTVPVRARLSVRLDFEGGGVDFTTLVYELCLTLGTVATGASGGSDA